MVTCSLAGCAGEASWRPVLVIQAMGGRLVELDTSLRLCAADREAFDVDAFARNPVVRRIVDAPVERASVRWETA